MSIYRKFFWCDTCEDEVVAIIEGEISFPPFPDDGPGPDVCEAREAHCEQMHPISDSEAAKLLGDIAAGDVF